jgi:hypothetical protein
MREEARIGEGTKQNSRKECLLGGDGEDSSPKTARKPNIEGGG